MDEAAQIAIGAAGASAGWALLQLTLSGWRDLGPMTVGTAAIAIGIAVSAPAARPVVAVLVAIAAVVAAIAWARGAASGVGRPALSGVVLAVALSASLAPWLVSVPADYAVRAAIPVGVTAALAALVALERKGVRRVRPLWYRTVPVER